MDPWTEVKTKPIVAHSIEHEFLVSDAKVHRENAAKVGSEKIEEN